MPQEIEFEEFNVDVLAETEKAFQFCFLDHGDIESDQFNVAVGIADWWAKKEGLL